MNLTRRSILRGMAAAPVAGRAVLAEVSSQLAGLGVPTGQAPPMLKLGAEKAERFWNFTSWLNRGGAASIRSEAREVHRLDPDIACLHSASLWTKVRMQRERNFTWLLAERKNWFRRSLAAKGVVEWWA